MSLFLVLAAPTLLAVGVVAAVYCFNLARKGRRYL